MERRLGRRLADQIGGVAVGDPAQQPGKGIAVDGDVVDPGDPDVVVVGEADQVLSRQLVAGDLAADGRRRHGGVDDAVECGLVCVMHHEAVVTGVGIGARTAIAGTVATAGDEAGVESGDLHQSVAQDAGKAVDVEPADDVDPLGALVDRRVVDLLLGEPHGELGGGQFVVQGGRFSSGVVGSLG